MPAASNITSDAIARQIVSTGPVAARQEGVVAVRTTLALHPKEGGSRQRLSNCVMVAEMELGFIRDRQRAGIDAAKAKGVYKGRPPTFVTLRKEGMGATEIARAVGCKRGNVDKALRAAGLK